MMNLLKRLRAMGNSGWHPIGNEAADEIESLRQQLTDMTTRRDQWRNSTVDISNGYEAGKAEIFQQLSECRRELADARRTAEYWKAEHLAGNRVIEECQAALKAKDAILHMLISPNVVKGTTIKQVLIAHTEIAMEALAIQPDDTAPREWGARLLDELQIIGIEKLANQLCSGELKPEGLL